MNNIDDIFKKGLDGKGMEYSEGHWGAMEQLLVAKKVGLFARYKWMIGTFSVVAVSCIIYFMSLDNTATSTISVDTSNADVAQQSIPEIQEINTSIINDENTHSEEAKLIVNENVKENSVTGQTVNENTKENSSTSPAHSKEIVTKEVDRVERTKVEVRNAKTEKNEDSRNAKINKNRVESNKGKGQNKEGLVLTDRQSQIAEANSMYTYPITATATERTVDEDQKIDDGNISKLQFRGLSDLTINAPSKKEVQQLKSPMGKKWSYYVAPHMGYVVYDRTRDLTGFNSESKNKSSEITKGAVTYGLEIAAKRKNWSIRSGIEILNLTELTNYTTLSSEWQYTYAKRIINRNYTKTPRGTVVMLIADVKVDSTEVSLGEQHVCKDCEVKFNYISVPLNLQYEFGKQKMRYFGEIGATASFLRSASGMYMMDSDKDGLVLENIEASNTVKKALLTADVRVGSKYYITPRMSLWASYGYGLGLNSMTTTYEQKTRLQSIRLGLEFKLR